jgi:hypothetical protein
MSALPAEVHSELAQLLNALQSSDNTVRSQAEDHLTDNWTATKPGLLLMGLVEQIQGSNDPTVRQSLQYALIRIWNNSLTHDIFRHAPSPRLSSVELPRKHESNRMVTV